jgi:hypothetical protein
MHAQSLDKRHALCECQTMKYGTDPIALDKTEQSLLQSIVQQPNTNWYLWIDSAFDVADDIPNRFAETGVNVYQNDQMVELQDLGPRIITVFEPGDNANKASQTLRPWLAHASGRPMLSLWASDHSAQAIAKHILTWSWAQTPDNKKVLLRLADTRSAVSLLQTLQPEQWFGLTQPLGSWLYINRQGKVESLPVRPSTAVPDVKAAQPPIAFDAEQVQAMAFMAEPDALLHYVATEMPDVLPQGVLASKMHHYCAWVCELAQEHEVVPFADRLTLLVSACVTRGASLEDKANLSLLKDQQYSTGQLAQHWPAKK